MSGIKNNQEIYDGVFSIYCIYINSKILSNIVRDYFIETGLRADKDNATG